MIDLTIDRPCALAELIEALGVADVSIEVGVNIEVLYSNHDHQLVLVVDDPEKARAVSNAWTAATAS